MPIYRLHSGTKLQFKTALTVFVQLFPPPLIIISWARDRTKWDRADVKMERNKGMVLNGAEQKTQSNGGQPFTDVIEQGRAERSRADTPTLSEVVLFRALGLPLFIRLGSLEPYGRL